MTEERLSRRRFLQLSGATLAAAGLDGCALGPSGETIVPYREDPPEVTPGTPVFYATSSTLDGYATGLLVESHVGRPTKVEGNPEHPASLGATSAYEQAAIVTLYDPERGQRVLHRGLPSSWFALERALRADAALGEGLHLLLEPTSSPLIAEQLAAIRRRYPEVGVTYYAPLAPRQRWAGAHAAFGQVVEPLYDVGVASVVVSLDADFLSSGPNHLRHAREFAARRVPEAKEGMNRLYVLESNFSPTGALADHRLPVQSGLILPLAAALFVDLVAQSGGSGPASALATVLERLLGPAAPYRPFVTAVARDLTRHRGDCLVIAGDRQPPLVHALAYACNELLGASGRAVSFINSSLLDAGGGAYDVERLLAALGRGSVRTLFVLGGNPVATLPADLEAWRLFGRARESVYLGLYENESSRLCDWYVPQAHALETWGDGRSYDGTLSVTQPLVNPLWQGKSAAEMLALLSSPQPVEVRALLAESRSAHLPAPSATAWERLLQRGYQPDSQAPRRTPGFDWTGVARLAAEAAVPAAKGLELSLSPSASVYDGGFLANVKLAELPAPLTKLAWGNAATVSPKTAAALGVKEGDVVQLELGGRTIELPLFVLYGQAEGSVGVELGWGLAIGASGFWRDVGVNAYPLRTSGAPFFAYGLELAKTGRQEQLANTQPHFDLEGRPLALATTLEEYRRGKNPATRELREAPPSFHTRQPTAPQQWGMSIDLSRCTGCNACVVACQIENNVPAVGRAGVDKSREMHWLRIDRYFIGSAERPQALLQPMLCQHCERAPCEYVCPVHATVHSPDGLNEMVYNRCVGTRFCSNNCPYKVRRFNWFDYNRDKSETEKMSMNPDVTVRARGVMEKCTFCVQRLREANIKARLERRSLAPGELMTACQQACPTRAIVFGDIADKSAPVTRLRDSERAYGALADIGTVPRVRYLVRVQNPNPELEHA
jgi:Fe-S-cluster-containing dehydrogenase component